MTGGDDACVVDASASVTWFFEAETTRFTESALDRLSRAAGRAP